MKSKQHFVFEEEIVLWKKCTVTILLCVILPFLCYLVFFICLVYTLTYMENSFGMLTWMRETSNSLQDFYTWCLHETLWHPVRAKYIGSFLILFALILPCTMGCFFMSKEYSEMNKKEEKKIIKKN
jgi:hypothetical protein